jgi:hypothetical protein
MGRAFHCIRITLLMSLMFFRSVFPRRSQRIPRLPVGKKGRDRHMSSLRTALQLLHNLLSYLHASTYFCSRLSGLVPSSRGKPPVAAGQNRNVRPTTASIGSIFPGTVPYASDTSQASRGAAEARRPELRGRQATRCVDLRPCMLHISKSDPRERIFTATAGFSPDPPGTANRVPAQTRSLDCGFPTIKCSAMGRSDHSDKIILHCLRRRIICFVRSKGLE